MQLTNWEILGIYFLLWLVFFGILFGGFIVLRSGIPNGGLYGGFLIILGFFPVVYIFIQIIYVLRDIKNEINWTFWN